MAISLLPARAKRVLFALRDGIGASGLSNIMRQAGLQAHAQALDANTRLPDLPASEYAALLQAIENYFGRGARGTLNRIGHATFKQLLKEQPLRALLYKGLMSVMSPKQRAKLTLRWLASSMAHTRGDIGVSVTADAQLIFSDRESLGTTQRQRDNEICWLTLGEIQEALMWSVGAEHDVEETRCKAKGDEVCEFHIQMGG